jgi:hypothetical protein
MRETTLTHPILGDQSFPEPQARKMMSQVNTYGWEFKKPSVGEKSPRLLKDKDAAANASTDKGETKIAQEEGTN